MDYNSFFYSPLSYELANADANSKSIHTFIMHLYKKTLSEELRWSERINMAHASSVIYSKGLREGLYGDEYIYSSNPDDIRNYEEKARYKETKEHFECYLPDKEKVSSHIMKYALTTDSFMQPLEILELKVTIILQIIKLSINTLILYILYLVIRKQEEAITFIILKY